MIRLYSKTYENYYIYIEIEESECYLFSFLFDKVKINTNIDKNKIDAIHHFKNYIRSIVPKHLLSITIDELDRVVYYKDYDSYISYGYIF